MIGTAIQPKRYLITIGDAYTFYLLHHQVIELHGKLSAILRSDSMTKFGSVREVVCAYMHVPLADVMGTCREERIVQARWAGILLCKELGGTVSEIAHDFKMAKDSVEYALSRISLRLELRPSYRTELNFLRSLLKETADAKI